MIFEHSRFRNASYILMGLALFVVLYFHFLPLLLAVILTYVFITKTNGLILWLRRRTLTRNTFLHKSLNAHNINLISTTLTIGIVLTVILLMSLGIYHLIHGGHIPVMLTKLAAILEDTKNSSSLPPSILNMLPNNTAEIKASAVKLIEEYSAALTRISKNSFTSFVYILIGIIIGAMLSFHRLNMRKHRGKMPPFKAELVRRIVNFETSFERVFLAQVKISLIDTALTGLYLYLILPLFSVELPFKLTVLVIAFIVGLITRRGQPDFQHHHYHLEPRCVFICGGRFAGVSGRHPQARIFPECENHRFGNRIKRMGTLGGDGRVRTDFRRRRHHRRAGLLCVSEE